VKKKYANRAEQQDVYRESKKWDANEWIENWDSRYPAHLAEYREYVRNIASKVAEEIGYTPTFETFGWPREKYATIFPLGHHPAEETVGYVAGTLYAFRKDTSVWVHNVSEGVIVAGSHFPDVLGYEMVSETHKHNLEISPTYSSLYRELLGLLDQRFGNNDDRHSIAIKQELAGNFVLPVKPEPPKPELKPEPKPAPSIEQPQLVSGYETPLDEQNKFQGFGTFGVSVSRTNPL